MRTSDSKKIQIKQTLLKTRERRRSQVCRVYELKIDYSVLSSNQIKFLHKIFIEAKWFYNFVLSKGNPFENKFLVKEKEVIIKKDNQFEKRKLEVLSSQIKQSLYERICEAIKILSKIKKKNFKVGKLKFKPEINSIELFQYKNTWDWKGKKIRIQGCKQPFKVNGVCQILESSEFANAFIVRKPSGYYIHVTTFQPKQERIKTGKEVGIDFGIKDTIVTSDGEKFNCKITESKKLKRLQMWFAKKQKGSKNRWKLLRKIKREYEGANNKKRDFSNKLVSYLKNSYDKIYIQDENLDGWKKWFGKQVQHSALGAIKARLKNLESTQVINRWEPTTKLCYVCGKKNNISLDERIYRCECGLIEDRDTKAAKTILLIGQKQANTFVEYKSTPVEEAANTVLANFGLYSKLNPMKQGVSLYLGK